MRTDPAGIPVRGCVDVREHTREAREPRACVPDVPPFLLPCPPPDDDPFIVLTETKFSFRCIPVWIGTLPTGLGSKKTHVIMFSP